MLDPVPRRVTPCGPFFVQVVHGRRPCSEDHLVLLQPKTLKQDVIIITELLGSLCLSGHYLYVEQQQRTQTTSSLGGPLDIPDVEGPPIISWKSIYEIVK